MRSLFWDQLASSSKILLLLAAVALTVGVLFQLGFVGLALHWFGLAVRGSVRSGFRLWERLFAWASWPVFLAGVLGWLVLGWLASGFFPALTVLGGLVPLSMGVVACLAYVFIDLERYEVGRGYKALHNPLKGQDLAVTLLRYGPQVGAPFLIAAAVGVIGGFALLNQGLHLTVGHHWYKLTPDATPTFADFLAYALINLYYIVDVLNLANTYHFLNVGYVRPVLWPASTLLLAFKTFFTLVLLQQVFASIRQGLVLAETIAEFWSPHEPIRERARGTLPQHGLGAVEPLLASLRSVPFLTKEQRQQVPLILAGIGPAAIPVLLRHLRDRHENVRAVAAAALGHLQALDSLPALVALRDDPSEWVRQSLAEAFGLIGSAGTRAMRSRRWLARAFGAGPAHRPWPFWKQPPLPVPEADPRGLVLEALRGALADPLPTVRIQAALACGQLGVKARAVAPDLIPLLYDADETVRCQAAAALGKVGGEVGTTVAALEQLLDEPGPTVKTAAAEALGALKADAVAAVPALVRLLHDEDATVRQAAAEAVGQIGALNEAATTALARGLTSGDSLVRAHTAEALGQIGEPAHEVAPALIEALANGSDRVRGKAAEALGKIGPAAAEAVPSLVQALRGRDSWVSALAAEALGEIRAAAEEAVPALVRSLRHANPLVRANAAAALGKLGTAAAAAQPALETAVGDERGQVRGEALRALGLLGAPTPTAASTALAGLTDPDPQVRSAAVETLGAWGLTSPDSTAGLLQALDDASDPVKAQVIRVLPRLVGPIPEALEALGRRLLQDDNPEIQATVAQALGQLGPPAASVGEALLEAAQTGDARVREEALRAIAMIQPPQTAVALTQGLKDASSDIRKVASAGWMNAAEIPPEAVPALVEALRDPETRVRTNAARALGRLTTLPVEAIPALLEATADPEDGLRLMATAALQEAPIAAVRNAMTTLLEDSNARVRLLAAGVLLKEDVQHDRAAAVVGAALQDPTPRLRKAALDLIASLGPAGAVFRDLLREQTAGEVEPGLVDQAAQLLNRLEAEAVEKEALMPV